MTPALSERASFALDELLALDSVLPYADPEQARGKCAGASEALAMWFRVHGVPAWSFRFMEPREHHVVALEDGPLVDLTARQFDADAPFPRIAPLDEYLEDFADPEDLRGRHPVNEREEAAIVRALGCRC